MFHSHHWFCFQVQGVSHYFCLSNTDSCHTNSLSLQLSYYLDFKNISYRHLLICLIFPVITTDYHLFILLNTRLNYQPSLSNTSWFFRDENQLLFRHKFTGFISSCVKLTSLFSILPPSLLLTCSMSRKRKYVLATSWNCSNRLTGRKVMMLYLDVMMQLLWMGKREKFGLSQYFSLKMKRFYYLYWIKWVHLTAYWNFSLYSLSLALTRLSSSAETQDTKWVIRRWNQNKEQNKKHSNCCISFCQSALKDPV